MKRFLKRFFLFAILTVFVLELFCRFAIDPIFYRWFNTYDEKIEVHNLLSFYKAKPTEHVDQLFIGSSRVPATISKELIKNNSPEKTIVIGGRGYSTGAVHLQALKSKLGKYPNYLKGANVFIEYPGAGIYLEPKNTHDYEVLDLGWSAYPHVMYVHIEDRIGAYWKHSNNDIKVKLEMIFLRLSAIYRSYALINENKLELDKKMIFPGVVRSSEKNTLTESKAINFTKKVDEQEALDLDAQPPLTTKDLERSILLELIRLVTSNGGTMHLYEMPLHSDQHKLYATPKQIRNKELLDAWLLRKAVHIISIDQFTYTDEDLPDHRHLRRSRRDDFTNYILSRM